MSTASLKKQTIDTEFKLDEAFLQKYYGKKPNFGFNGLGEFVYYRTYSRLMADGRKETFLDTAQRVVEGCYEIQRRHCKKLHVPWDYDKALESAHEMFERIWDFKFLPPGRGLWMMGTPFVYERGGAALNNCAFVSTQDIDAEPAEPFRFMMDMAMLGVGVGFDTKGADKLWIKDPGISSYEYVIPDSREGWVDSLGELIDSYTVNAGNGTVYFNYDEIRPAGSDIKGFGGKASGPGILRTLHEAIRAHLDRKVGRYLTSVDITDLMNYVGKCVVAGNVRRCLPKGTLVHLKKKPTPIEDVKVGDLVATCNHGWQPVTDVVYQGVQELITIYLASGNQFKCTAKHRIAVWAGDSEPFVWKRADELTANDAMVNANDSPERDQVINVKFEGDSSETYDLSVPASNCFVANGYLVHNTAQIVFGEHHDSEYYSMKNAVRDLTPEQTQKAYTAANKAYAEGRDVTPYDFDLIERDTFERFVEVHNAMNTHRWASNNSVFAEVGDNYDDIGDSIAVNGEPGLAWLSNMRDYGRMIDGHQPGIDGRVAGGNPCLEQSLESYELCTLVETFPANHANSDDYMRTLKFAYLYGKTVTLLQTHNPRTNSVMLRNRRIGLSQSGIIQAFAKFGRRAVLNDFCNAGFNEIKRWDNIYSEWLCVPKSIKVSSVKPSGSVSLVAGATPGIHHPEARSYWRRVRLSKDSVLVKILQDAGYHVEPLANSPNDTVVVKFAVSDERVRPVEEVSIWEQVSNAVDYQTYWADNQVSCTVKFKPEERKEIARTLEIFEDRLKGISFLPHTGHGYQQAPYEPCTAQEVIDYNSKLKDLDFTDYIYEAVGSYFCDGEACSVL